MKPITALTGTPEFKPHAIEFNKGMGITFGIQHANLVVAGIQIAGVANGQVTLGWFTSAEQHRFTLLGPWCRGSTTNAFDHLLDQAIGPEEDFFCTAVEAKWLLDINITGIQAGAAAQGCVHGAGVAPLDQGLRARTRNIGRSAGRPSGLSTR